MAAGFTTGAVLGGLLTDALAGAGRSSSTSSWRLLVLAVAPFGAGGEPAAAGPRLDAAGARGHRRGSTRRRAAGDARAARARLRHRRGADGAARRGGCCCSRFVAVEARGAQPLVPLRVLRRRTVAFGNLAGLLAFATETGLVFALTLYLQDVLGYSALASGPGVRRARRREPSWAGCSDRA